MKLKFLGTVVPQQEGAARVSCISCAPNGEKSAFSGADRSISIFDDKEEIRDRFTTKPVDNKFGKRSFTVLSVSFSPDSSKVAVGQSDNVVYIYKIGHSWNEKKVIVNKLMQTAPVSAMSWPFDDKLLIGLLDGKVRVGLVKTNKCSSLYKTEQPVVTIATNPRRTHFVSGHFDGSVIIYTFSSKSQQKICTLQISPYCLVFTLHGLVVAGSDRRVCSYTENGVVQQQFDYSDQNEKEFSAISVDPTGQNVVVASYDRIRLFSWSSRRGAWDEEQPLHIKNLYTVSALGWKGDGSTIYAGTLCGGVISIDCCLRRGMLKSRFETTYVTPSHVIVRDVQSESRTNLISSKGLGIEDIRIMGKDRFVVGSTSSTLVIADTENGLASEIEWNGGGHEKFYWDFAHVCMIVNAGEITLVEFGVDGPLGWVRTELTSLHLISVRVGERGKTTHDAVKKIAYLLDRTTIAILNLITKEQEAILNHSTAIDWLELNETASKLLFRDKRSRISLVDLITQRTTSLLTFCTYVQWVPLSDVIVAQSGENLHVWYNPDVPEQMTTTTVQGEVETVFRDTERTEVIVQEAVARVAYELDHTQIEFATALEERDFERAVRFLEVQAGSDTYSMWLRVGNLALEQGKLVIAQRCFAAIKDVAKARMIAETINIATQAAKEIGGDGTQHYKVRANLAKMAKKLKQAEQIYLEQNCVDEAIQMYQSLHKWDEALELAKATNHPGYEQLKASYYRALFDTGQEDRAAELKASEGDAAGAVQLFLKANNPSKALQVALSNESLSKDETLLQTIAVALLKSHLHDKAGELFEKMKEFDRALAAYRQGNAFNKAVELSRFAFPENVVELEEEWGDFLLQQGQHDAAINHFLEANKSLKAVEAAMKAKEWSKAVQIIDVIQDEGVSKSYYGKIAEHYANIGEFDRAERLYIEAELQKQAIAMYIKNNKWADAYRISEEFLGKEETTQMYERKAEELESQGRYQEAEQLFISIGLSNRAIQMYRTVGRNEEVVRLVEKYHGEHLQETHKRLALDLEEKGDLKAAEEEFLKAGDWKAAVTMYRENEMWNDAYRLAKREGGETAMKQIGFLWAKSLGGEAAVKLLSKLGMLMEAVDHACETGAYDFGFEIARLGAKERLPDVHLRMAAMLEDEGKLDEAAKHFIEAGKAEEAVAMFIHDQDWANAEKIAVDHCPRALPEVFMGEARRALQDGDHARAESFLLRANKPEIILDYFKMNNMWTDALRIAREYLPHRLQHIEEEEEKAELRGGGRGVDSFVVQAKEWETQTDWSRAVATYLKVSPEATPNTDLVKQCSLKAADIAIKFLIGVDQQLVDAVIERLDEIGLHEKQAEILLTVGHTRLAVEALCKAQLWAKAKQVASEYLPELVEEVDKIYRESLKNEGRLGELIDVDVIAAIDILVERGQWDKALDTAKQQKHRPLLDKYVAQYCAQLIQENDQQKIIRVFEKYGASANPANFNMYKTILNQTVSHPNADASEEFQRLSSVRDLFFSVYDIMKSENDPNTAVFERYVMALHLMCIRHAIQMFDSSEGPRLVLRQSLALLRYSDLLPPDRIFYEAGSAAKEMSGAYGNMAFLLLNHYLDLVDAIDEGNAEMVDYSAFEGTDIPTEVSLPDKQWLESLEHEEIKEWVLAVSVDDSHSKELVLDSRGTFEGSLIDAEGTTWPPCIVTGCPVLDSPVDIGELVASREDLNCLIVLMKSSPSDQLINVQEFVSNWAGAPLTLAL